MKRLINIGLVLTLTTLSCRSKISKNENENIKVDSVMTPITDSLKNDEVANDDEKAINIDSVLKLNLNIDKEFSSESVYNAIGVHGEQQLYNGQAISFSKIE